MVLLSMTLAAAAPSAAEIARQYERWERRVRTKVSELHIFPGSADKNELGDVVISFSVGDNGRPTDAVIQKSSGNPVYDSAARHVVRRLGRIGPVPSITDQNYRVRLKLSYGFAPAAAADRQLASVLDAERRANSQRNLEIVTTAIDQTRTARR